MRRLRLLSLALVLALAAVACDVQTASAPTGDLDLYATFDDVQDLARGHFVEMSDVPVGSVAGLELDGYRVRVQLDLEDDVEVPRGTRAVIRRTSLLGANFGELVVPGGVDPPAAPHLEDTNETPEPAHQHKLKRPTTRTR